MKAIAYTRVSSKGQDLATQRFAIEQAAAVRGDEVVRWYSEKKTGTTLKREELVRLRADARAGRLAGQRLYVFRLDRLSRGGIRDTFEVIEELRAHKVELVTVSDGFDLNGPAGDIICAVISWAGRMELLARNERVASARLRLEAEGRSWGRPSRLSPEERTKILTMRAAGRSFRKIAIAMKVPLATVARACRKGLTSTPRGAPRQAARQQGA